MRFKQLINSIIEHEGHIILIDFFSEFIPVAKKVNYKTSKIFLNLYKKWVKYPGRKILVVDGGNSSRSDKIVGYKQGLYVSEYMFTPPSKLPHETTVIGSVAKWTIERLTKSVFEAISHWGIEADDIIAYIALERGRKNLKTTLLTRDKDLIYIEFIARMENLNSIKTPFKKGSLDEIFEKLLRKIGGYDSDMKNGKKNLREIKKQYTDYDNLYKDLISDKIEIFSLKTLKNILYENG